MVVMQICFLIFVPSVFADELKYRSEYSANDVESQINRRTEDDIVPNGSLLGEIMALKKELGATRTELTKAKTELRQVSESVEDVSRTSKEIFKNKKDVEDLKSEVQTMLHNMKTSYQDLSRTMKNEMDGLRGEVKKNTNDIVLNTNKLQGEISTNVQVILALKKDFENEKASISTRLTSITGDLSTVTKLYNGLKFDIKKNADDLKNGINKNKKDISSNTNKLQKEITKNIADIQDLKKTSITGDLSAVKKLYNKLKLYIKEDVDDLRAGINKNKKDISSNTNKLQREITKNIADINGLKKDFKNEKTSVSTRLASLTGGLSTVTKSYHSLKLAVKTIDGLKAGIYKNKKDISSNTNRLQGQITRNIADIKGLKKDFKNEKTSVSIRLASVTKSLSTVTKSYNSLKLAVKTIDGLKAGIYKNQKYISSNTKRLQGEIRKNIADIQGLKKDLKNAKTSVSIRLSSVTKSLSTVTKSYNSLKLALKTIDGLKAGIYKNKKDISSNTNRLQGQITKNVAGIQGMKKELKKDVTSLSSRLTSEIGKLSANMKSSYNNIQRDMKKNMDGLRYGIAKNKKDISTNTNRLQSRITKNVVDILGLGKYLKKELTTIAGRVTSVTGKFSSIYTSYITLQRNTKKEIDRLKDGLNRNTKVISANTNALQRKITKNIADIQGLKKDLNKQVTSVSTRLKSVVVDLSTKISVSSKQINERKAYLEGIKNALVEHARIVFYPKGKTDHFSLDVYRDYNAHFFAFGWPHKYDSAHRVGDIGLKPCLRTCYLMHKRDRRYKAMAYYSEGSHCWCYKNPRRTTEPHSTVLLYMYM